MPCIAKKENAKAIVAKKADYLLSVKENQPTLKYEIEKYVQDETLRKTMDTHSIIEKRSGRIERRTAFSISEIDWMYEKEEWDSLLCIGAVSTQFETKKGKSDEWYYYISNRRLTADELLKHTCFEWSVETMHWLLDVHFSEDYCRIEDMDVQQNLNMVRKIVLNSIRKHKEHTGSKRAFSKIMFDCLMEPQKILPLLHFGEN